MRALAAFAAVSLVTLAACATTTNETPAAHVNTLELADAAVANPARTA